MTQNKEQKWQDLTLKSLEAKLRGLSKLQVPEILKAKLFAKIPHNKAGFVRERQILCWPKALGFGAAAAAIIILALIFVPNSGTFGPSQTLIADLNDGSIHYIPADQNNTHIEDTNYAIYLDRQ